VTARIPRLIVLFGVAMGFLEAAVVIYLRLLYYPGGFDFPLVRLPDLVVVIELGREAATIVMLWAVAALTGKTGVARFAWFAILFGIWDLVYYLALKLVLGWPASLLTWDVLFLIPFVWTGPVLAPVLISIGLIGAGTTLLRFEAMGRPIPLTSLDWTGLGLSFALLLASFGTNHQRVVGGGIPDRFSWEMFAGGCAVATLVAFRTWQTGRRVAAA